MDAEIGLLRLDRVLHSTVYYPADYGFIPRTYEGQLPTHSLRHVRRLLEDYRVLETEQVAVDELQEPTGAVRIIAQTVGAASTSQAR
jgi:inorganic pyrophosphatase